MRHFGRDTCPCFPGYRSGRYSTPPAWQVVYKKTAGKQPAARRTRSCRVPDYRLPLFGSKGGHDLPMRNQEGLITVIPGNHGSGSGDRTHAARIKALVDQAAMTLSPTLRFIRAGILIIWSSRTTHLSPSA